PATAAAASSSLLWAMYTIRSLARAPVTTDGSVAPLASIAMPIRSLPSPPVLETVVTWFASCTTAPFGGAPLVASSWVAARVTSWAWGALTAGRAGAQFGPAAVRTPYTSVGPGVWAKTVRMDVDRVPGNRLSASAGFVKGRGSFSGPPVATPMTAMLP